MFWAAWHLAFAFLAPDGVSLPPETIATALRQPNTYAKQTRAWRFDKDIPTPTLNVFSVTRFELMHIRTVETRYRSMKSRREIIAIIVVLLLSATMYGWYR